MISRNKRGIRRASVRVRLAIAAAVLVGGGAAAAVAVTASHNGAEAAQSAGYYTSSHRQPLSETQALSSAMNGWNQSPSRSLSTLTQMTPMSTFNMMSWHTHTIALQRGTVIAATRNAFVIKSTNHMLQLWYVNHGTKILNVGSSQTGMRAMTGGTMSMPDNMKMNMGARTLAKGDLVFIFGERVHGKLVAQLVLFVAPFKFTQVTPTATPSWTATPTATPSWTATPAVPAPTSTSPTFANHNS